MEEFHDAHVHYLWRDDPTRMTPGFSRLQAIGLRGLGLIVMARHPAELERCLAFVPAAYHDRVNPEIFAAGGDGGSCGIELPDAGLFAGCQIFPYLDSRYLHDPETRLEPFQALGYRGLKLLYVPREDKAYGMLGWPELFQQSESAYQRLTLSLIEQAVALNWPIIFHVDLRQDETFVRTVLSRFGDHHFIFPHFGFSRRQMARLLSEYPAMVTDFSSLLPFMRQNPDAYRAFIEDFQDQVLFASDATIDWPELIEEYLLAVKEWFPDDTLRAKILRENYRRIHS